MRHVTCGRSSFRRLLGCSALETVTRYTEGRTAKTASQESVTLLTGKGVVALSAFVRQCIIFSLSTIRSRSLQNANRRIVTVLQVHWWQFCRDRDLRDMGAQCHLTHGKMAATASWAGQTRPGASCALRNKEAGCRERSAMGWRRRSCVRQSQSG
ncbi:hypothetical protein MPH_11191 [Macrophomina phaseolina MS6]|uniref:Uncharacterized protein n=1 Tax=Macrophomina phaseolina (strain MS6) TaxID=1126212 RepID=K2RAZ7_MACPH|nr:hypothetical protein MPH_11191 [Macrophomina phaseolina MS6]